MSNRIFRKESFDCAATYPLTVRQAAELTADATALSAHAFRLAADCLQGLNKRGDLEPGAVIAPASVRYKVEAETDFASLFVWFAVSDTAPPDTEAADEAAYAAAQLRKWAPAVRALDAREAAEAMLTAADALDDVGPLNAKSPRP